MREDTVDIYKIEREHAKKKGIVCYKFWRLSALSDSMVNDFDSKIPSRFLFLWLHSLSVFNRI